MKAINKHLVFEDLYDFWQYSFKESTATKKSSRETSSKWWYGNVTWEQAKALAIKGWREGLNEIAKYTTEITPRITEKIIRPFLKYDTAGYTIDIGRFMSSDPECFMNREFRVDNSPGKVFTLVCSISTSCKISLEVIIQKGAMVCALADAIEYAGHRVEIICNDAASFRGDENSRSGKNKDSGWFEVDVTIKKADRALNMIELAFCLAHPAMSRRIMFSVAEINGWSDYIDYYGCPASATNKGDVYIPEIFSGVVSNEKAVEWIVNQLGSLGIEMRKE